MIAYCGINCDECSSCIGTITGEMSLLVKMNEKYGDKDSDAVDFVCLGRKNKDVKLIASDCARCKIRMCAMERGSISGRLASHHPGVSAWPVW